MSTGAEYRYVYDDLGQLKREDNTVTGKTYIYEYDDAGNITSKNTYTLTAAGVTPSGLPSSVSYGYTDSLGWGDLLTSYGNVTITYDAIGNPLSYYNGSSYTFTWKNGRQLATASVNGDTLSFNYNDEGIRTSKTVNGVVHTYHLSGSDIIAEEWGNNLVVYLYDADGSPLGMQYRTSTMAKGLFYTFWFEKNLQGDIVAVYNSAGTKLISYTYDAWGNCTTTYHNATGTNSYAIYNPFSYRGYYFDSELGLYYLNSRYYDPAVGRFINADTLVSTGQGILGYNMFTYCNNEPVFHKDSQGNEPVSVDIFDADGNPLNDLGKSLSGGSSGAGNAAKVNSIYQFKNESSLNSHYQKHNREMGYKYHSPQEYLADANDVIKNGQYIPGKNAYVRYYNYWGGSNYQFVGMSFDHSYITTFHIRGAALIFN